MKLKINCRKKFMIVKIYFLFRFIFVNKNITKINNLFLLIQCMSKRC